MFSNFFSENRAFYEVIWKNMVEPDRPHDNTLWPMRYSCWISKATGTLGICSTYCFFTATMVTRTLLHVMFIPTLLVFFLSQVINAQNSAVSMILPQFFSTCDTYVLCQVISTNRETERKTTIQQIMYFRVTIVPSYFIFEQSV